MAGPSSTCTVCFTGTIKLINVHLLFRWLCSSRPRQPFPSEPASAAHPQPDAGQPHAGKLRQHGRAHYPLLHASSAHHHGPPSRDGPHGSRGARDWSWCRRGCGRECGDECWDSSLHVHAPAPDKHANPGWDAAYRNHQPLPFVKGGKGRTSCPRVTPLYSLLNLLSLWLLQKLQNEQGDVLFHLSLYNQLAARSQSQPGSFFNTSLYTSLLFFSLSSTSCLVLCVRTDLTMMTIKSLNLSTDLRVAVEFTVLQRQERIQTLRPSLLSFTHLLSLLSLGTLSSSVVE